ncbi:MAG: ABC transporter permease subunit [Eggerthellaceae bacterium]|nr:ABC transporter permease subunit [Eggerthellaceae bacterium]
MFNLLKSDLFRLVRGRALWVCLAVLLFVSVMGTGLLTFISSPEFASMVNAAAEASASVDTAGDAGADPHDDKADAWESLGESSEAAAWEALGASSEAIAEAGEGAAATESEASDAKTSVHLDKDGLEVHDGSKSVVAGKSGISVSDGTTDVRIDVKANENSSDGASDAGTGSASEAAAPASSETAADTPADGAPAASTPADAIRAADDDVDLTSEEIAVLNDRQFPSFTHSVAQMLLTGGFLGMLSSIVFGLACVADFSSGFAKTLLASKGRRRTYYAEKLVLGGIVAGIFTLAGAVITGVLFSVAGFSFDAAESVGSVALWLALAWLTLTAYNFVIGVVAWSTHSTSAAVTCAVLVSSTIAESLVGQLLALLSAALKPLALLPNFFLANNISLLGSGSADLLTASAGLPIPALTPTGWVLLVCLLYIMVLGALALTLCKRKDI